ncbi:MAG: hypothetical protein HYV09_06485 [Deltaproteobacteria bacterium]|nr:hypothetical protein [Deltaproteobacteria bacterium]
MSERMSIAPGTFEHAAGFDAGETHGGIRLGKFEAMYEELFAEVIEDGIITVEERERLDKAADRFGLDKERLKKLEAALQSAWEAHHQVRIVVHGIAPGISYPEEDEGRPSLVMPPPPSGVTPIVVPAVPGESAQVAALRREIDALRSRIRSLEGELEDARNNVAVEVDLGAVAQPVITDDPTDLQRRIRQDPTDPEPMHLLFRWAKDSGKTDEQWCISSALCFLGKASNDETAVFEQHRRKELPKFTSAVSPEAWRRLLFHPDEELLVGDIFSVITSAVLLGRVSALRRDKLLPKLDPQRKQDPATSTISAVRAIAWSAAILGLKPPPIFVDPELNQTIEMIPGVPPNLRVGMRLLSGRTPLEVAFECGRSLACFREEHFVRWLFPGVPDLEDLFLAALSIANPALPIPPHAKARVAPIAAAIQPVLEAQHVDRLRGYFLRFVEEGGRTNLQRWAHGVDKTACRAGLVLCNDLSTAGKVLSLDEKGGEKGEGGAPGERMQDLLVFSCSDRYFNLRKQLGLALP